LSFQKYFVFGLTDFVIVTVVNALEEENKKPTNHFDVASTIAVAAQNTVHQDTTGNPHRRSNIQKQAYPSSSIPTIREAYGFTGTNFNTHIPYINGIQKTISDIVRPRSEIVLIRNDIVAKEAILRANRHRIIPDRTGS